MTVTPASVTWSLVWEQSSAGRRCRVQVDERNAMPRLDLDEPEGEVWLVGGYGDVGFRTAQHLLALSTTPVVLAGRDLDAAQRAAEQLGRRVRGTSLDIAAPGARRRLGAASAVVSFTEALPVGLACDLVGAGIEFVDTSADQRYTTALRAGLDGVTNPAAGFVCGAGLVPGLSNVLAADLVAAAPSTDRIDVVLEMGLGRHHGLDGTAWALGNLAGSYTAMIDGTSTEVTTGALARSISFGAHTNASRAVGYGFADQTMIAAEHELATVRSFLTLNPAAAAKVLPLVAGSVVGRFVAGHAGRFARLLSLLPAVGDSGTRLAVEGFDRTEALTARVHMVSAHDQAELTGVMVAAIVAKLCGQPQRRGHVPVHDLVDRADAAAIIAERAPRTRWTD